MGLHPTLSLGISVQMHPWASLLRQLRAAAALRTCLLWNAYTCDFHRVLISFSSSQGRINMF